MWAFKARRMTTIEIDGVARGTCARALCPPPPTDRTWGESTHEVTSVTRAINPVEGVRFSGPVVQSTRIQGADGLSR